MLLKHLRYLSALAQTHHFSRAAEQCGVSQPTLSAGIKQLELSLGVQIVRRRRNFVGFTPEGEIVTRWARRTSLDVDGLLQELSASRGALRGHLKIGVVPSALVLVTRFTVPFCTTYPDVTVEVLSRTSNEILRGLATLTLDIGLTYIDNEPLGDFKSIVAATERYVLVTPNAGRPAKPRPITWREAATHRLCLLPPDMQNRRIIDHTFARVGGQPRPQIVTNSMVHLWSVMQSGPWSTVMPQSLVDTFGLPAGYAARALIEPDVTHKVGFVFHDADPLPALMRAFLKTAAPLLDAR
ncbi:MAG: LysR family transcriptional regulator [Rhodospirillales bacterium]